MSDWSTCALCPRLCRPACPVATGSHREAATPTMIATVLIGWERGKWTPAQAARAATLCVDCGACEDLCHVGRPLPHLLREARRELLTPRGAEPLHPIEDHGTLIAVEADDRPFAQTLAKRLGRPVRRWRTHDHLGVGLIEHHLPWKTQASRIRDAVGGLEVVVADGGVAQALTAAQVPFRWLHQLVGRLPFVYGSCQMKSAPRPLACCGGAEPLAWYHPEDAKQVGKAWLERAEEWVVADGRCRNHLRGCGGEVTDVLDALLREAGR